jgi:hypothetical protein
VLGKNPNTLTCSCTSELRPACEREAMLDLRIQQQMMISMSGWPKSPTFVFFAVIVLTASGPGWCQAPVTQTDRRTVCSLSEQHETEAPKAFEAMMPTFQHPRCINCHGATDPFTDKNHGGGEIPRPIEKEGHDPFGACSDCHTLPGWKIPDQRIFFVGKDAVQLCGQMKREMSDASSFLAHITEDRGRTPFIDVAFQGTRAIEGLKPEPPPPFSHAAFVSEAEGWVSAMGGAFRGDEGCGCTPHHYLLTVEMQYGWKQAAPTGAKFSPSVGRATVPMVFTDDGSFTSEASLTLSVNAIQSGRRMSCTLTGEQNVNLKIEGTVDDQQKIIHIKTAVYMMGGGSTLDCKPGGVRKGTFGQRNGVEGPGSECDLEDVTGLQQACFSVETGYFSSSLKYKIDEDDGL